MQYEGRQMVNHPTPRCGTGRALVRPNAATYVVQAAYRALEMSPSAYARIHARAAKRREKETAAFAEFAMSCLGIYPK